MIETFIILGCIFFGALTTYLCIKYIIILPNLEEQINSCIAQKNFDDAEFLLQGLLSKNTRDPLLQFWQAEIFWHNSKEEQASMILERLYKEHINQFSIDKKTTIYYRLASWYQKNNFLHDAWTLSEQLLNLDSDNPKFLLLMGEVLLKQNNNYQALTYFQRAIVFNPIDKILLKYIADILYDLKNYQESLIAYISLSKEDPKNGFVWFRLGKLSEELKNTNKAITYYIKAEQLGSIAISCKASYQNALLHMGIGKVYEAIMFLEKSSFKLRNDKNNTIEKELKLEILYYLASVYETNNNINSAIALWEEIKKIEPQYKDVQSKINEHSLSQVNDFFLDILTNSGDQLINIICEFIRTLHYIIDEYSFIGEEFVQITVSEVASKWRDVKRSKYLFLFWCSDLNFPMDIVNRFSTITSHAHIEKIIIISAGAILFETRILLENKSIDFYDKNNIKDLINERKQKESQE
ncbi:MAG: tetratricopeptide repeat protein [Brevinema sp.]